MPQLAVSQLKICVPKISFARHVLPTHYIFSHILSLHGCAAYCSGDPLIPLVHAAAPGYLCISLHNSDFRVVYVRNLALGQNGYGESIEYPSDERAL